jgi:O-antigen/teichoic acid export membrane protein
MSMKRAALLTGLWSMGETWGFRIVSAVVFLLLARLIEPTAFGLAALAQVYLVVVQMLCDQGITTALIQRESLEEGHKDSAFWANLAVGVILMALTILFAGPFADLYGESQLAPVLRWYSLAPLFTSMSVVQTALARRALRYQVLAVRQTAGALVGGLVGVGMALAGMGVFALVGQGLVTQAMGIVILWNVADWRPRFAFSRRHFMDLFGFGFNVLAADIIYIIGSQADRLLLGYFFGAAEVGYYTVAQRLITFTADFVGGSTQGTVLPLFSRIQKDKARVARGLKTAQSTLTMIVFPAFVGLAVVTPSLLRVGIGVRWDSSILPTQILTFGSLAYWLGFFFGNVITALGHPAVRLRVVIARSLTQVVMILIGVRYGIPGVALGVAASQIIFYGVELTVLRRLVQFSVPAYLGEALKPGLATAAMAASVVCLERYYGDDHSLLSLVMEVMLGIAVYGAVILAFARMRVRQLVDLAWQLKG